MIQIFLTLSQDAEKLSSPSGALRTNGERQNSVPLSVVEGKALEALPLFSNLPGS
jgi:hypothetical protein